MLQEAHEEADTTAKLTERLVHATQSKDTAPEEQD